jgi:DNA-binding transcriptional ArsR family regulator
MTGRAAQPTPASSEEALARFGRALAHPLRIRIVLTLAQVGETSPRGLAHSTGEHLSNVSYHVRYLAALGAIELQRTRPRRGAVQHFYALAPALRRVLPLVEQIGAATEAPTGPRRADLSL